MKCKICETEFVPKTSVHKCCSLKCKHIGDQQARSKKPKTKICGVCKVEFKPYTSLDKFCSANCRVENQKSKRCRRWSAESTEKRIGKNNPAYRNGMYTRASDKTAEGSRLFLRIRNGMRERMKNEHGFIYCERCGTTSTYQFEMHHVVYRSEKPNHPHLHDERNLINLCMECHNWFHKAKENRSILVETRKLYELFGEDVRNKN